MAFVLGQAESLQGLTLEGRMTLGGDEEEDEDDSDSDNGDAERTDDDERSDEEESDNEGGGESGESDEEDESRAEGSKTVQDEFQASPLRYMHPNAFGTLKSLKYIVHWEVDGEDVVVQEPYYQLLRDNSLAKLVALERINIIIHVAEHGGFIEGLDNASFDKQWAALDNLLVPPGHQSCTLPKLKEVSLTATAYGEGGCDFVRETMDDFVFKKHFQGLKRLAGHGKLNLTLDAWSDINLESDAED